MFDTYVIYYAPLFLQICMVYVCCSLANASKNALSDMPDDPVFSGPNGEMVALPSIEEKLKKSLALCWCCIKGFVPKVRGLPHGVAPLSSHEREELLGRLAGNWKIQPLPGGTSTKLRMVAYEDLFVRGDKMVLSGGTHNATSSAGGRSHQVARANEIQESKIVPFRDKNGTLYLDQIGSKVVRQSADGGELELDNAMGFKLLLQREWKRQGHGPPPSAPTHGTDADVPIAYPVATSSMPSGGTRDIGQEILQLKQLRDEGALSEEEFGTTKTALLKNWSEHKV